MTRHVCNKCGSTDVLHEYAIMLDPNDKSLDKDKFIPFADLNYNGFDYCTNCQDNTDTMELGDNEDD
jgi:hypothetical protein